MSRNYSRSAADGVRKRRRRNSLLVSAVAVIVIVTLLALEQVALLYLIATLGIAGLLLLVAFSDLHGAQQQQPASVPADDAAAIADGVSGAATATATTFGSVAPRRPRRRQKR